MFELYKEPVLIPYIIMITSLLVTYLIWLIPSYVFKVSYFESKNVVLNNKLVFGIPLCLTIFNFLGLNLDLFVITPVYLIATWYTFKFVDKKSIKWINGSMLLFMYFLIATYAFFNYKIHYITYVFFASNDIVNYVFKFKPYFLIYHVGDFLGSVTFSINDTPIEYKNEPLQYRIYMFYYVMNLIGLAVWYFIYLDVLKKHNFNFKQKNNALSANKEKEAVLDMKKSAEQLVVKEVKYLEKDKLYNINSIEKETLMNSLVEKFTSKVENRSLELESLREKVLTIRELEFDLKVAKHSLENHSIFSSLNNINDLKYFMSQHVYCVWDFMSLLKRIQNDICCTTVPWLPPQNGNAARLINDIVLEEETDVLNDGNYTSHFNIYIMAMEEVGADTSQVKKFIQLLQSGAPIESALLVIPEPARKFVNYTINVATKGKTEEAIGSFFNGRESVIPAMFTSLLNKWKIDKSLAPMFYYYLVRHIDLDGEEHGPAAERLISILFENEPEKYISLLKVSLESVKARITLWDEILINLQKLNV